MLSCCDADGEILSVPEFFAVGKTFRALFWCAVKGGGHCQFLNISVIYKVHLRRVPRPSVFINHLTLPAPLLPQPYRNTIQPNRMQPRLFLTDELIIIILLTSLSKYPYYTRGSAGMYYLSFNVLLQLLPHMESLLTDVPGTVIRWINNCPYMPGISQPARAVYFL